MKHLVACLSLCLSFAGCSVKDKYQQSSEFAFDDFAEKVVLSGKTLEFDEIVMAPGALQVYDSVLVTLEHSGNNLCHLFNLNTHKKMGERLKRGQGPDEMLMAQFVEGDKSYIQFIDIVSSTIYKYDIQNFISNENPKPVSKIKLSEMINFKMQALGNKYIGHPYFKEKQLYVFDAQGSKVMELADFPESTINYSDIEKADAFYMGFVSDGKDKLAICYYMTDLIDIYATDGTLLHRVHGPEQFFSYVRQVDTADGPTTVQQEGKNRDAYFSPEATAEEILVLYNGGYVDEEGHTSSCKQLMSFSWDAVPQKLYQLDDPIFSFCVDETKRKIYGISVKPEYHLVEYSY